MTDTEGRWIPVHLCDACFQPITNIPMGLVEWEEIDANAEYSEGLAKIYAYHKQCYRHFDRPDSTRDYRTMELSHFWESFLASAPFQSYDREDARRRLNLLNRIE